MSKIGKRATTYLLVLLCLGIFIVTKTNEIKEYASLSILNGKTEEKEEFRALQLSEETYAWLQQTAKEESIPFSSLLTVVMLDHKFVLKENPKVSYTRDVFEKRYAKWKQKEAALKQLEDSYKALWDDLKYFPVAVSKTNKKATYSYSDSWMFERNYGGKRGHEGTDIMAGINERGLYPILSITDGVIENIGWLEKGGYRIGIRSKSGAYFYYAHLSEYAPDLQEGQEVKGGEFLGYMGDTGYSKVEGTTGKFDVHLHLGVYIKTAEKDEISLNPYWMIKSLEDKKIEYDYE